MVCAGTAAINRTLRHLRAEIRRVNDAIAIAEATLGHVTDHDLERYHLGMVTAEAELAPLEEHLLGCGLCADRAEEVAEYVDIVRAAITVIGWGRP